MAQDIKIAVTGAGGRMGRTLIRLIAETDGLTLSGGIEAEGSPHLGSDLGLLAGLGTPLGIAATSDALAVIKDADALVDFSVPEASLEFAALCAQARIVHVIGTTGFADEDLPKIDAAARHATIVKAGNMSLGVNLLAALARQAAAEGRGVGLGHNSERGRDGITGARARGKIGFASLRGGSVVGEHDVIFATEHERIVLRHVAEDRSIFARGALKAATWGQGKGPGLFNMADVLGIE